MDSKTLQYVLKYKQMTTKMHQEVWPPTAISGILELVVLGMYTAVYGPTGQRQRNV